MIFSIFGDENSEKSEKEEQREALPRIEVGRKITLGVNEKEIFGDSKYSDRIKGKDEPEKVEHSRYEFLRKKVKPN